MNAADIHWDGGVGSVMIADDGTFPGNPSFPMLIYKAALDVSSYGPEGVERTFAANGWGSMWRNGVYSFHHYHSTAHEALGVYAGSARVQLGGSNGLVLEIEAGDVLVLPAGTAHKLVSSNGLALVGSYPPGPSWDLLRGEQGDRPAADRNIADVKAPAADPVYGTEGPLTRLWGREQTT